MNTSNIKTLEQLADMLVLRGKNIEARARRAIRTGDFSDLASIIDSSVRAFPDYKKRLDDLIEEEIIRFGSDSSEMVRLAKELTAFTAEERVQLYRNHPAPKNFRELTQEASSMFGKKQKSPWKAKDGGYGMSIEPHRRYKIRGGSIRFETIDEGWNRLLDIFAKFESILEKKEEKEPGPFEKMPAKQLRNLVLLWFEEVHGGYGEAFWMDGEWKGTAEQRIKFEMEDWRNMSKKFQMAKFEILKKIPQALRLLRG